MRLLLALIVLITSCPIVTPPSVRAASVFTPAAAPRASLPEQDPAPANSPSPTPDVVLEQAQRDAKVAEELKKKAVSDRERAEAEAARLKALTQPLGAPANVTVPTGSVTTDAAGWVESQMLAQEAAKQITKALTDSLCTQKLTPGGSADADKIKTLVIHNPNDLTAVELYGSIMGQLSRLKEELIKKNGNKGEVQTMLDATDPLKPVGQADIDAGTLPFAAPGIATGIIKSVAELINLFRTDTSFTNQAITLNENSIVSQIVSNLNAREASGARCEEVVRVYYPALYPPRLLDLSDKSPLIVLLNDVQTQKVEAAGNVERVDARIKLLKDLSASFKSLKDKSEESAAKTKEKQEKEQALADCRKSPKPAQCRKKIKAEIKVLDEAIAQLDKDIKKLNDDLKEVTADPKKFKDWIEKLTDLRAKTQALVTATDIISAKLNTPDDSTKLTALAQLIRAERLHTILSDKGSYTLHVEVKANGTTKVKKNLFVDAKVRHSAGADLTYQLIEGGGVIAQAQQLKCYIEYQSAHDVQEMVSGTDDAKVSCKFQTNTPPAKDVNLAGQGANRGSKSKTANGQ